MTDKQKHDSDGPKTIRESGDPDQGAPNKHQSQTEWEKLKSGRRVKDEQGGDTAGGAGADSFGTTTGSVTAGGGGDTGTASFGTTGGATP